jgi:hypothetical protein
MHDNTWLQIMIESHINKNSKLLAKKRTLKTMEHNRNSWYKPTQPKPSDFWQSCMNYELEKRQELVKRSVRDESTWDVTHLYIEAMLGISLYSYLYLNACLSYYFLYFLFNKIRDKGRTDSAWQWGGVKRSVRGWRVGGEKWPKQCMHIWINEF